MERTQHALVICIKKHHKAAVEHRSAYPHTDIEMASTHQGVNATAAAGRNKMKRIRTSWLHSVKEGIKLSRVRTCANSTLIAKLSVSAAAVLLGFAAVLVIVYGVIPSAMTQAEMIMEHDAAAELYARTLKSSLSSRAPVAVPESTPLRDCFSSVRKINPDIIGRIHIESLDLGYLVTQERIMNIILAGIISTKSTSGTIFLDCRCDAGLDPPGAIIYCTGKVYLAASCLGAFRGFVMKLLADRMPYILICFMQIMYGRSFQFMMRSRIAVLPDIVYRAA